MMDILTAYIITVHDALASRSRRANQRQEPRRRSSSRGWDGVNNAAGARQANVNIAMETGSTLPLSL